MKIKKNGKVINLTESDVKRIVKRTLNEGVEGSNNITIYPEKVAFGYDYGKGFSPNKNITVNQGDTLKVMVLIPSDAPKGSIVSVTKPETAYASSIKVGPMTIEGQSSGAKKYLGEGYNSVVKVIVEYDDLETLKKIIGSRKALKLNGSNFTGGDKTVPIEIPKEMNVVTGSSKS